MHPFRIAWRGAQLLDLLVIARKDLSQAFQAPQQKLQIDVQTAGRGGDGPLEPANVVGGSIGSAVGLRLVM